PASGSFSGKKSGGRPWKPAPGTNPGGGLPTLSGCFTGGIGKGFVNGVNLNGVGGGFPPPAMVTLPPVAGLTLQPANVPAAKTAAPCCKACRRLTRFLEDDSRATMRSLWCLSVCFVVDSQHQ